MKPILNKCMPTFVILGTVLLFFYPVIFADQTFFFRDFHRFFYPLKFYLAAAIQADFIPYWNPQLFCGSPYASFVANAVFYPLSIIFLLPDFPTALNIFILLHFLLGFWFFFLFITSLGLSHRAAVFTGVSFCFGGYMIAAVNVLNHLQTLIWLPAILWALRRAICREQPKYYFGAAGFLVLAMLGGAPQLVMMMVGLLLICALAWQPPKSIGLKGRLANLGRAALVLGLAIGIAMVQLGPTYVDYLNSVRLDGFSYQEATAFSLPPARLTHLIVPRSFPPNFAAHPASLTNLFPADEGIPWLLTIYPGFLILPLALLGTLAGLSMRQALWPAVFVVGILLALGSHTPFFHMFYTVSPSFRFPVKFMFLVGFCLLVLAGYGFDILTRITQKMGVSPTRLFGLFLLVLTLDLYSAHRHLNPVCDTAFYSQLNSHLKTPASDKSLYRIYVDNDIPALTGSLNTINNTHAQWQLFLSPNLGMLYNFSHVGGATGMELTHQYLIAELLEKPWSQKIEFLRLANVKYIFSPLRLDKVPALSGRVEPINPHVYRINDPLPRAWLVGQVLPGPDNILEALSRPPFDIKQTAVARDPIAHRYTVPAFKPIEDIEYRQNTISLEVVTEEPAMLVLSESYYPGWRVRVDGEEKKGLRLNYLFQGVALEKGRHQVVFSYRPLHFNRFLALSGGALLLFLAGLATVVVRRKESGF